MSRLSGDNGDLFVRFARAEFGQQAVESFRIGNRIFFAVEPAYGTYTFRMIGGAYKYEKAVGRGGTACDLMKPFYKWAGAVLVVKVLIFGGECRELFLCLTRYPVSSDKDGYGRIRRRRGGKQFKLALVGDAYSATFELLYIDVVMYKFPECEYPLALLCRGELLFKAFGSSSYPGAEAGMRCDCNISHLFSRNPFSTPSSHTRSNIIADIRAYSPFTPC